MPITLPGLFRWVVLVAGKLVQTLVSQCAEPIKQKQGEDISRHVVRQC